ncbi:1-phosphofructokinase family hexose kinase [Spongisporangium articulatum]|uniref:1-phosphofructokinase family hexose kinase n=1 Tax=Spongisporangium articulatum TaxID=3362603 RepID=A0ABW8AGQ4_9ACTN
MITTVTPNPSLDRTLHVTKLRLGGVNRTSAESVEPSGKGVNVALALATAGVPVTAVLPAGGPSGVELLAMLDEAGLDSLTVGIAGSVRSNVTLVEADGRTTKVNEPGPTLSRREVELLVDSSLRPGTEGDWVAWCGSLPGGFDHTTFAAALAAARSAGRRVAVDASGRALEVALSGGPDGLPHLVKPNADELAELTGARLRTLGDVVRAARVLVTRGVQTVLVSLGGDGAVLVDEAVCLHGAAPVERVVNTVGAGDAFLAGYLAVEQNPHERLASALRFGAVAVQQDGTLLPHGPLAERNEIACTVGEVEEGRALSAPAGRSGGRG